MTQRRRPRGSVKDPADLGWSVERSNKERFAALAARAGMSNAALFDLMVETLELDDRGLPMWVPRKEGQLPIDKAG